MEKENKFNLDALPYKVDDVDHLQKDIMTAESALENISAMNYDFLDKIGKSPPWIIRSTCGSIGKVLRALKAKRDQLLAEKEDDEKTEAVINDIEVADSVDAMLLDHDDRLDVIEVNMSRDIPEQMAQMDKEIDHLKERMDRIAHGLNILEQRGREPAVGDKALSDLTDSLGGLSLRMHVLERKVEASE